MLNILIAVVITQQGDETQESTRCPLQVLQKYKYSPAAAGKGMPPDYYKYLECTLTGVGGTPPKKSSRNNDGKTLYDHNSREETATTTTIRD